MYCMDNIKYYCTFSYQLPFSHIGSVAEERVKLLFDSWSGLLSPQTLLVCRIFVSISLFHP